MPLRDRLGLRQRRIASTIKASSHSPIEVASRCGRVDRSAPSGRAFQRATVRGWTPSSRASAAWEAVLFRI
jgi:hypothetical protein